MAFENQTYIALGVVIMDLIFDALFIADQLLTFFLPEINGEGTFISFII